MINPLAPTQRERGSVTLEFAVLLPAVLVLAAVIMSLTAVSTAQIRGTDAARQAARMAAVGEPTAQITAAVRQITSPAADLDLQNDGQWVRITVSQPVKLWGQLNLGITVQSRAQALVE